MTTSPVALRTQLLDLIRHDLLGPANGPEEIVDEPSVRGRYILGVLAPIGQPSLLDVEEELGEDQTVLDDAPLGDDEEGPADPTPKRTPGMMPTSIGLTFTVDGETHAIRIGARWGRYFRREHPDPEQVNKRGERRRVWQRAERGGFRYFRFLTSPSGEQLTTIAGMVERGELRPLIDSRFPFEQLREAIAHSMQGRARGKIVVEGLV